MCIECLHDDSASEREYRAISMEIEFMADDGTVIVAELSWSAADPWAVRMDFGQHCEDGEPWHVDRELFAAGLDAAVGVGHVRFRADLVNPRNREMVLIARGRRAVLRFDLLDAACFVAAVDREVRIAERGSAPVIGGDERAERP